MINVSVSLQGANLYIKTGAYNPLIVERIKSLPDKRLWDPVASAWRCAPTLANMEAIKKYLPQAVWDQASEELWNDRHKIAQVRKSIADGTVEIDYSSLDNETFKFPPYKHQKHALLLGRDLPAFGYFMDQGTGKTKVLIDDAAHNFRMNRIDCLLIVCPNSVKTNWVNPDEDGEDEVRKHMPPDILFESFTWSSKTGAKYDVARLKFEKSWEERTKLKVVAVNIEALSVQRCFDWLYGMTRRLRVMIAVDESTRIANKQSVRTKSAFKIRAKSPVARIATGTPVVKNPLKAFSQLTFLDPDVLGISSMTAFKNRYCVMGGYMGYEIKQYKNLDDLSERIRSISYRVLKEECLDLPSKVYSPPRVVEMTDEQVMWYKEISNQSTSILEKLSEHGKLTATNVLTAMLRQQQVTSGFIPIMDEYGAVEGYKRLEGRNPKLEALMDDLEEVNGKVIIWCRFVEDIKMISERLAKEGVNYVQFYGETSEEDRIANRTAFQDDPSVDAFVGQINTGGIGITLTSAKSVRYYSNTFNTEDRVQSEDRAHRIGQDKSVDYLDFICRKSVDEKILKVLRSNIRLSEVVMKDNYREWI